MNDDPPGIPASSPAAAAAVAFKVVIAGAETGGAGHSFLVTGPDPATGAPSTREYRLRDAGHAAYLDVFESLARDFGTAAPRSRRPPETGATPVPLRPLLTRSLSPDILYGYGDPAVTRVAMPGEDAAYYLVVTSNDAPQAFPILRSRDLADWQPIGFVFPEGRGPGWALEADRGGEYWAPELHQFAGRFLVCFAAREGDQSFSIGLAQSDAPEGPFLDAGGPLVRGNVIDPHILVDRDGTAFLFWKEDSNELWPGRLCGLLHEHGAVVADLFPRDEDRRSAAFAAALWPWAQSRGAMERFFALQGLIEAATADFPAFLDRLSRLPATRADPGLRDPVADILRLARTTIYAQRLDPGRLTLAGERVAVLRNDRAWEGHLVEGAWVTEHAGRYYLFYAANDFSTPLYGIGVAVADRPLGPYRKADAPLLRSSPEWSGPGHPSVADGPDGRPWLFLHAFFPGRAGYKEFRACLAVPIAFHGDQVALRP